MKIASWNVNSIKSRIEHVKTWLSQTRPDILLMQELKGTDFPSNEFSYLGYKTHAVSEKAYNGVAIASLQDFKIISEALPGYDEFDSARYLETRHNGITVINIYLPNGNPCPGPKFDYKLAWMDRLINRARDLLNTNTPFMIAGDFNVIPEDRDCYNPEAWKADALFHTETRQKYRELLNLGLYDALRVFSTDSGKYTFWDYQAGAWQRNFGIRIDHFLCSPQVTDMLVSCDTDSAPRGWDKPSDHVPVIATLGKTL